MRTPIQLDTTAALAELGRFNEALRRVDAGLQRAAAEPIEETPRRAVWSRDKVRLLHFGTGRGRPLLIVYALINRPWMLDLQPSRSLIRRLLERGLDVYLIDWGRPDLGDRLLGLEDYVADYLDACVDEVRRRRPDDDGLDLLGVCQGGVLSLCYAALAPRKIRRLITMVTPIDFHAGAQPLVRLLARADIEAIIRARGNIPGQWMSHLFNALQPFKLGQQKYLDLLAKADDPDQLLSFLRMEAWIQDCPDLAAKAFRQFANDFIRDNGLVRGGLKIAGCEIDLSRVRQPILNIYARRDHLVPPASARALAGLTGSRDYREFSFDGGHIGIYVSRRAQQAVPAQIAEWVGV